MTDLSEQPIRKQVHAPLIAGAVIFSAFPVALSVFGVLFGISNSFDDFPFTKYAFMALAAASIVGVIITSGVIAFLRRERSVSNDARAIVAWFAAVIATCLLLPALVSPFVSDLKPNYSPAYPGDEYGTCHVALALNLVGQDARGLRSAHRSISAVLSSQKHVASFVVYTSAWFGFLPLTGAFALAQSCPILYGPMLLPWMLVLSALTLFVFPPLIRRVTERLQKHV